MGRAFVAARRGDDRRRAAGPAPARDRRGPDGRGRRAALRRGHDGVPPGGRRRRRAGHAVGRHRRRRGERHRPPHGLHRRRDASLPRSACRRAGRARPDGLGAVLPHVLGWAAIRARVPPASWPANYVTAMAATPRSKGSDHWAAIPPTASCANRSCGSPTRAATAVTFVYQFDWVAAPVRRRPRRLPRHRAALRLRRLRRRRLGRLRRRGRGRSEAGPGGALGVGVVRRHRRPVRRRPRPVAALRADGPADHGARRAAAASSTTRWPRSGRGGPGCGTRRRGRRASRSERPPGRPRPGPGPAAQRRRRRGRSAAAAARRHVEAPAGERVPAGVAAGPLGRRGGGAGRLPRRPCSSCPGSTRRPAGWPA